MTAEIDTTFLVAKEIEDLSGELLGFLNDSQPNEFAAAMATLYVAMSAYGVYAKAAGESRPFIEFVENSVEVAGTYE